MFKKKPRSLPGAGFYHIYPSSIRPPAPTLAGYNRKRAGLLAHLSQFLKANEHDPKKPRPCQRWAGAGLGYDPKRLVYQFVTVLRYSVPVAKAPFRRRVASHVGSSRLRWHLAPDAQDREVQKKVLIGLGQEGSRGAISDISGRCRF